MKVLFRSFQLVIIIALVFIGLLYFGVIDGQFNSTLTAVLGALYILLEFLVLIWASSPTDRNGSNDDDERHVEEQPFEPPPWADD